MLLQAHKQGALAVEDLQAPDGLPPPLGEELDLLQQTAAGIRRQGRPHFFNGAITCEATGKEEKGNKVSGSRSHSFPKKPCFSSLAAHRIIRGAFTIADTRIPPQACPMISVGGGAGASIWDRASTQPETRTSQLPCASPSSKSRHPELSKASRGSK